MTVEIKAGVPVLRINKHSYVMVSVMVECNKFAWLMVVITDTVSY